MGKVNIKNGRFEDYTIILSTRDHRHLGQISGIQSESINGTFNLNSADNFTFTVSKHDFIKDLNYLSDDMYKRYIIFQNCLWNNIVDFKFIYVKELDEYFEIRVSLNDGETTEKTVTCTSACEAELSQYNIDSLEINNENDVYMEKDDYEGSKFCDKENPKYSLLHRVIADKAPHYSIGHVDDSLKDLQRSFSVNNSNIYNFLTGEVAEEFNCLFVFDSVNRIISAYDLYSVCKKCGHRGDFYDTCPECHGTDIEYFGDDTTIYIDKNNLTDAIQFEANADEVKNCLKLVAGDDTITAAVRLLNPNGSDYIYQLSDFQKEDMPSETVDALTEYIAKIEEYKETYQAYVSKYYESVDHLLYLKSGMMPTIKNAEITAKSEGEKLTEQALSPMALSTLSDSTSTATVNSALKNYAKIFVKSGYVKVEIQDGAEFYVSRNGEDYKGTWIGHFVITNYSDKEDIYTTPELTILVNSDQETFVKQKVLKNIATEDDSVFDILNMEDFNAFKEGLKLYCYNRLNSFYDALDGALSVLQTMGYGKSPTSADYSTDYDYKLAKEIYENIYKPYYERYKACEQALDNIQNSSTYSYVKDDVTYIQNITMLEKAKEDYETKILDIQDDLDLYKNLGEENYKIFCAYKREDVYNNANYISDGLDNMEIIKKAEEFLKVANEELQKASEPQYTVTSTLFNLLVMKEFQPMVDHFELGNWMRIRIDGQLYRRLRLISYSISGGNIANLTVEFSTISKKMNLVEHAKQVIQSAQSMGSSFSYIARQSQKGADAKNELQDLSLSDMAMSTLPQDEDSEMVYTSKGLLFRQFNEETGSYDPEQFKINRNALMFTDDDWATTRSALGKQRYSVYDKASNKMVQKIGYGLITEYINAGYVTGSTIVGGEIFSTNFAPLGSTGNYEKDRYNCVGSFIDLQNGCFSFGGKLRWDGTELMIDSDSILEALDGDNIIASNLQVRAENIQGTIKLTQIDGTNNGLIQAAQIHSLPANKITDQIQSNQIKSLEVSKLTGDIKVKAKNIDTSETKIKSEQIESIEADKITGDIVATSLDGTANLSSVTTVHEGTVYNTYTGEVTIGETTLHYVNGLLVNVTTV